MSEKNYFITADDLTDESVEKEPNRGTIVAIKSKNGVYICNQCGEIVDIEKDTCPHCSAPLYQRTEEAISSISNNANTISKLDKIRKQSVIALIILLFIAGCAWWGITNKKMVIDLNQYISFTVDGYDTIGIARCNFDRERFETDYFKKLSFNPKERNDLTGNFFDDCISGEINEIDEISNGDIISLEWNCKDEIAYDNYGVVLQYSDMTYEVQDLEIVDYLVNIKKLPSELYKEYQKIFLDAINSVDSQNWADDEKISVNFVKSFLLYQDPDNVSEGYKNYLFFIYEINYKSNYVDDYKYYWYGYVYNILRDSSGKYNYDANNVNFMSLLHCNDPNDYNSLWPDTKHIVVGYKTIDSLYNNRILPLLDKYSIQE